MMKTNVINRDYYLNQLIRKRGNGFIKVITGLRRCGKSYLVFTLFKNYLLNNGVDRNHIIEMAFDDFANEKYKDPGEFYSYIEGRIKDDGTYYCLLDEVQELEQFEAVLNGLMRRPNIDIYVTGSNAHFLSRDVITEFSGRGDEIHLNPLSFAEFMAFRQGNLSDGWKEYAVFGGLPPVVLQDNDADRMKILSDLNRETYIRDIALRHHIRNKAELEELLNVLASGVGSLTNPQKLADTFKSKKGKKLSPTTINTYIGYLVDAFIIRKAQRFDVKGKKYIDTPYKCYFGDIGLRNAQIGFRQIEETHLMENILFNELCSRGYQVDVGVVTTYGKNGEKQFRKQLEVDFVCNLGSKRYYIQSAYSLYDEEKTEQESKSLRNIDDSFKKIIIAKDILKPWYTESGILVTGLFDFLLNPDSLE